MLQLHLPSIIQSIRAIEPAVSGLPGWAEIPEVKRRDAVLCAIELVTNAIVHGNREDSEKFVFLSVEIDSRNVIIVVEDEGSGFDHSSLRDPTIDGQRDASGGRGIHVVRTLADGLTFHQGARGFRATVYVRFA